MEAQGTEKRLRRSREDSCIGGVCAGLADYFELDAIVVRILMILCFILTLGLAGIVYLVLWVRLPLESDSDAPYDVMPESAESNAFGCVDCGPCSGKGKMANIPLVARLAIAVGLMILFLVVAMGVSPLVPGTQWWQFWPLAPLMAGLCLIIIPVRTCFEAAWHAVGIMLTALSASVLPMALGIMSWATVGCAFGLLWPLVALAIALFVIGLYRGIDAFLLVSAFCFVAFCLMGITFCVVPGELEALLFHMPSGHSFRIAVVR